MRPALPLLLVAVLFAPSALLAQRDRSEEGFELGSFRIRPVAEVLGAYNNRVSVTDAGDIKGDLYSEAAASIALENDPARYDLSANAAYGYRFYQEYRELNSDFYQARLAVNSDSRPLKLGVSSLLKKTLDYDTVYEPSTGEGPAAILTGRPSTRTTTRANAAYEKRVTDRTTIAPGYDVWHYFQNFETQDDAEWLVHRGSLQLGYSYTEKTRLFLTGFYSLQTSEFEDGTIGTIAVGAKGRFSDKTSWEAQVGASSADYEISGKDQGVVGLLRANWNTTEKLSAYIYGSSNFQPGSGGVDARARRVYRLGYGAAWRIVSRWSVRGELLHDYQEIIGSTPDPDDFRNFITVSTAYDLTPRLALAARVRYIMDQADVDEMITSLSAVYRY